MLLPDQVGSGSLVHSRRNEVEHTFEYPVSMLLVDVDEMDSLPLRGLPLSLSNRDFVTGAGASQPGAVRDEICRRVVDAGYASPGGPILSLLQPRSWGLFFNPVIFFFCHDQVGNLATIVAEIHNTPWNERFSYVLDARGLDRDALVFRFPKTFHVSPFADMDFEYRWSFRLDADRIGIDMALERDGRVSFWTRLDLELEPADRRACRRMALRFPLQSAMTLVRIYGNAARLALKGARFYPHPRARRQLT